MTREVTPMPDVHGTIITRVVTEKTSFAHAARREHVFKVDVAANKHAIKDAIETLFEVRVVKVRTLVQPSKRKTMGRSVGRTPKWKKAYVTLHPDDTIEGLEG
jgi:large subunit ribosomal protein L23